MKQNKEEQLLRFIKDYIKDNCYPPTVREMCHAIKVSSTSTISYYLDKLEKSNAIKKNPNKNRALEVVEEELTPVKTSDDMIAIPVLGTIAAGAPILAVENCEEYFYTSPNMFRGEGLFMLNIHGDSMINAGILDGDQVVIRQQSTASNGEIVAAMIDGSATLKRFYKENGRYRLQPENDTMEPIYADNVEVIGKLVGLVRKF
ncbi:MAG: transcriptional repressor LexA [Clostridiales bacterium]|nr:transcriptional repressor LexA [Clostridiales bacterium]